MKKLKLEDIRVDSFFTHGKLERRGTVRGAESATDEIPVDPVFTEGEECGIGSDYGTKPVGSCSCPSHITWVANPRCCDW